MGEARRWSVEAKEFELLIKGGLSGVRIVEKRNNRLRFICVQRDELLWLVGAVEKAANVDSSEVFWDQSRAGYIRLITQRRANRHGRYLTIEEFEGRRRSGSVLIPEGRYGQGWHLLISELHRACSSLKVGRGNRMDRPEMATVGKRSFAEVVGATKGTEVVGVTKGTEKYDSQIPEPIAGKGLRAGDKLASVDSSSDKVMSSTQLVPETPTVPLATGGSLQQPHNSAGMNQVVGKTEARRRSAEMLPGLQMGETKNPRGSSQGVACQETISKGKGRVQASFIAKEELGGLREWLRQLRSEVDAGLVRVDVVLKKLENVGPGQMQKTKPKKKFKFREKRLKSNGVGVGRDPGPTGTSKTQSVAIGQKAQSDGNGLLVGRSVVIRKPMVWSEVVGAPVGSGRLEGTFQKPKSAGLGRSGGWVQAAGGLGSLEGPDLPEDGGDLNSGDVGIESAVSVEASSVEGIRPGGGGGLRPDITDGMFCQLRGLKYRLRRDRECCARNHSGGSFFGGWDSTGGGGGGCVQISPTECSVSSEPQKKSWAAPVGGSGTNRGDRSLVSRPECSWVAGRTGFGPVHTEEVVGSSDLVGISMTEVAPPAMVVPMQNVTDLPIISADKDVPAGAVRVDQDCSMENTALMEVYRRKDALEQGSSKGRLSDNGNLKEGDMVETPLQGGDYDQGVGQSNNENPLVENTLKLSLEVSNVAGLSCDGEEGRKEECLRRIVIEKAETGCGEDTVNSDFQQAGNNMGRFWGNDSDDEA
jgi:hypothetical protein